MELFRIGFISVSLIDLVDIVVVPLFSTSCTRSCAERLPHRYLLVC